MEQLNKVLPMNEEENTSAAVNSDNNMKSPLLNKVRQKFSIFAIISLIFGITFTFLFYKAGMGLNCFLFSIIMVLLLVVIMRKLEIKVKKTTFFYYTAVILFGVSSSLTANESILFFNTIGILIILDLSLLHQFHEDQSWDFLIFTGKMFALPFLCLGAVAKPFTDSIEYFKNTKLLKNDRTRNTLIGVLIAIPLLFVIVALLSSADLLFGKMTKNIYEFLFSSDIFYVVIMALFGTLVCYCIICGALYKAGTVEITKPWKQASAQIAVTVIGMLCVVYAIFCVMQVLYLFTNGFMLPAEFTFAEYARRGFFELLTVTIINLVIMIISTTFFRENKVLKIFLTVMTVCTYVMIASAVYRMLLYIGAYNLTLLRLYVLLFLLIDALSLAGVIMYVYNKKFPLFFYCVVVTSVCYLIFSFSKPDYFIASYQIANKESLNKDDIEYMINDLSVDTAPVLIPYLSNKEIINELESKEEKIKDDSDDYRASDTLQNEVDYYYKKINNHAANSDFRDFNYSRYQALRYAKEYSVQ